ncbi:MAG TPA: hypothetical protein VKT72_13120, partial [Candidatus Baltobacteraceae bacterium]|nr:hypothetical protein [Candidatus Baltobacteraceae bacterium]
SPSPAPVATLLIESKGVTMPLKLAVRTLTFKPFIPPVQILQSAIIPPLNVDQQKNHGLAIEYAQNGSVLLLSQWPRAGFAVPPPVLGTRVCEPVSYKSDGLLWATRNGLVMTLQPDGRVPAARIVRESRRLLRLGACGESR